jgi:hypothetical protein
MEELSEDGKRLHALNNKDKMLPILKLSKGNKAKEVISRISSALSQTSDKIKRSLSRLKL